MGKKRLLTKKILSLLIVSILLIAGRIDVSANEVFDKNLITDINLDMYDGTSPIDTTYTKPTINTNKRISVRSCGAVGDGVTDDTAAIRAAIKKGEGTSVYFPPGEYVISKTLFIPANTILFGDGDSSKIIACPGFKIGRDMLKLEDVSNVIITRLCISGNSNINTREQGYSDLDGIHLLDIWHSSNIDVYDCAFVDNIYCAVRMILDCNNMNYYNCRFKNVDCGVSALGSGSVDTLLVEQCTFDGHLNSEPICLYGKGLYSNITINKNVIKNKYKGHAIYAGANGGTVSNITVSNNALVDNCIGVKISNASTVNIYGNTLNTANLSLVDSGKGIDIRKCSDINIYGNIISNTKMQAIYIGDCVNASIHDNNLTNCGYRSRDYHYIDVRGENSEVDINSNTLIRTDTSLSPYVLVSHSKGNVSVTNNKFSRGCKILLCDDSEGMTLQNNNVTINNMGKNHTIQ
ncbi:parallel beta-helix repeat (two copies) [Pseudobutyrivibrio sp. 49]|uniref:glycosyl hydrolase family 28-related protein n=1 Tax=Pseudobutyrivibrio sp. 49 TaxID=1855344 RepID=UPI00087E2437|nr:glycosyl hydrolase family 28-related protein [Pseudobutyrivibrio sp. 49]SDI72543.1 parallel beta-helix repeat (two copies) [Pseudobutyrivibrio sp. 49]